MTFTKILLEWYRDNARDLPWRKTSDPYLIWISEVILQQTRIAQGLEYYFRFIERFPSVGELAKADEQEVLKTWQGLGYYSRARNMHKAAKEIMEKHNGIFPAGYEGLLMLKGIGEYTAAAVASIAYNHPCPVVDGNVLRFFSRFFGIHTPIDTLGGKRKVHENMRLLLDKKQPGIFNQAVMEFGALQCTPVAPNCDHCPLGDSCFAKEKKLISSLPVKENKTKITHRYFYHFVVFANGMLHVNKRTKKDIWQNLYEFPLYESLQPMELSDILQTEWFLSLTRRKTFQVEFQSSEIKHILSHQTIHAYFYIIRIDELDSIAPPYIRVTEEQLSHLPVSRLTDKFIKKFSQNLDSAQNKHNFTQSTLKIN